MLTLYTLEHVALAALLLHVCYTWLSTRKRTTSDFVSQYLDVIRTWKRAAGNQDVMAWRDVHAAPSPTLSTDRLPAGRQANAEGEG